MWKLIITSIFLLTVLGVGFHGASGQNEHGEQIKVSDLDETKPLDAPPTETLTQTNSDHHDDDDDEETNYDKKNGIDNDHDLPPVPEGMVRENIMKWSTPTLSDEEAYSVRLPSSFKCDGCTAIAFQISTGMAVFHEKKYRKKKKMAPESEVIELIENICDKKTFENYGLKQMGGINRLSGPGTEAEEEPGMMQGGGKWPNRLAMMCGEIAGELDEYDMYKAVVEDGPEKLFQLICQDNENSVLAGCMEKQMKDEL